MPVPNDLSAEEEAMFSQHGVQPAGQGGEPVKEGLEEQPQAQPGEEQHGDRVVDPTVVTQQEPPAQEPAPGEVGSKHRADGTFKNREELEADRVALEQQRQPDGQADDEPKLVPLAALHESRQREATARQQAQLAVTRLNAILSRSQQHEAGVAPNQMPKLEEDPVGYIQALEQRLAQFEEQQQQANQHREIDQAISQDEEFFKQSVPDYDQASDYYVQSRAKELLAFYTPQQAQQILMNETRQIAKQAWERGVGLGQMVYQLAQARGYSPGNTAADPTKNPIPAESMSAQQQPTGRPSAAATIDSVNDRQKASRSLSGGAGGVGASELNAQAILNMDEDEFAAWLGEGNSATKKFMSIG